MTQSTLAVASASGVIVGSATGSIFGPVWVVVCCAVWGAFVALAREGGPKVDAYALIARSFRLLFVSVSVGVVGTSGLVAWLGPKLALPDVLHPHYLFGVCAFALALLGARVVSAAEKLVGRLPQRNGV